MKRDPTEHNMGPHEKSSQAEAGECQDAVDSRSKDDTLRADSAAKEKMASGGLEGGMQRQLSCDVCDFETAIAATGYGKYNCLLMAASFFGFLSSTFSTSTMSLILPSAGCDLNLSNVDKGTLNAVVYVGMIVSAFVWGFLCDTLGRRKLLIIGYGLEACFATIVGLGQNFSTLFIAKLFSGFISSGPYAIMMTYLAESHATKHRPSILVWTGIFSSVGTVGLPALAWLIIPQQIEVSLFEGVLWLPSWRIFLLISTIPSFIGCTLIYFFAESPKFLMSQGRREEALEVFRSIYSINTGLPKDTYPVKHLVNERKACENSKLVAAEQEQKAPSTVAFFRAGWEQVHPLFQQPHLPWALLVFLIQFGTLFGLNTIRLWTPQLFSSMIDNEKLAGEGFEASSVCELLGALPSMTNMTNLTLPEVDDTECVGHVVEDRVYINSMIIGVTTAFGYFTSGYLIRVMGNKWLMVGSLMVAGVCSLSMYWATTSDILLVINCIYVTVLSVASTAIVSVVVDLFPTMLRTMAVSLTMMLGRVGAMTGNLVFPFLLDWNCAVPFFLLSAVVFVTGLIALLLPKTKGKALV